ncbi:MAG: 50S ribosome-binding GTPase, partial [Acidobacteria bacterium]|nr:50S ribosome-binding GTPase [Acidobacteriota bacterium]
MSQLANNAQFIDESEARPLLLVGNPNVGKSLLFTRLTNRYVTVSNYPGTTVEMTTATALIGDERRSIIDTPGINSLLPQSQDEIVARDLLLREPNIDVMQVGDIANLRRTLLLALQLCEYEVPFALALNMADELRSVDDGPDPAALERVLGVPVVSVSALRRWNIGKLKQELGRSRRGTMTATYPPPIERGVAAVVATLKEHAPSLATRGVALSILAGDATLRPLIEASCPAPVGERLDAVRAAAQGQLARPIGVLISHVRVAAVDTLMATLRQAAAAGQDGLRDRIGRVCMHSIKGIPILIVVLAL